MLFEPRPKDARNDLYDRDEEYEKLKGYIKQKSPLIIIKGLRRSGKTSLLKTVLNEEERDNHILVDLRAIDSRKKITRREILTRFEISINDFVRKNEKKVEKLLERINSIDGFSVAGYGISFDNKDKMEVVDLIRIFEELNAWIDKTDDFELIVIAVDEAQIFNEAKDFDMTRLIASIYDNYNNLIVILSGSEIGLLDKFVNNIPKRGKTSEISTTLAGFSKETVELSHFKTSESIDFLQKGFEQLGPDFLEVDGFKKIISKVVDNFDGVVGWLNNFGVKCKSNTTVSEKYIEEVKKDGFDVVKEEFDNLFSIKEKPELYKYFMEALSLQSLAKWENIKKYLKGKSKKGISDSLIESIKDDLMDHGFIVWLEGSNEYYIPDPMHKEYFS